MVMLYEYMKELGYSDKDIEKIVDSRYTYSYHEDTLYKKIKDNFNFMLDMGYKREDIIRMTRIYPAIFIYSLNNLEQKINDIVSLGYNLSKAIMITVKCPALFGYSIDSIREKKEFYDSIGLSDVLMCIPARFIQSIELSKARYVFYNSLGINIDMSNYQMLFVTQDAFVKKYGINNKELIDRYGNRQDSCYCKKR